MMKTLLVVAATLSVSSAVFAQNNQAPLNNSAPTLVTTTEEGFRSRTQRGGTVVSEPVPNHLPGSFDQALHASKRGSTTIFTVNYPMQFAFPAVSAEEVALFMMRSDNLYTRFWHPDPVPPRTIDPTTFRAVSLVRSLEKRGARSTALASLPPDERKLADDLLTAAYVENAANSCKAVAPYLKQMKSGFLVKTEYQGHGPMLRFVLPENKEGGILLTDPNQIPDDAAIIVAGDLVDNVTLGELVKALNKRSTILLSVAPELADKPVIVQNAATQTPEDLLRSIAAMYQLRVLHDDKTFKLSPPALKDASSLSLLRGALLEAMPRPLRAWTFRTPEPVPGATNLAPNDMQYHYASLLFTYLNQVFEKRVKDKTVKEVAFADLTSQERSALATALVNRYLANFAMSFWQAPQWVDKYDQIVVDVGRTTSAEGEETGYVNFSDAQGKPMVGVSSARFSWVPEKP